MTPEKGMGYRVWESYGFFINFTGNQLGGPRKPMSYRRVWVITMMCYDRVDCIHEFLRSSRNRGNILGINLVELVVDVHSKIYPESVRAGAHNLLTASAVCETARLRMGGARLLLGRLLTYLLYNVLVIGCHTRSCRWLACLRPRYPTSSTEGNSVI